MSCNWVQSLFVFPSVCPPPLLLLVCLVCPMLHLVCQMLLFLLVARNGLQDLLKVVVRVAGQCYYHLYKLIFITITYYYYYLIVSLYC